VNYKTFLFELIRLYYTVREVSLFWPTLYTGTYNYINIYLLVQIIYTYIRAPRWRQRNWYHHRQVRSGYRI